VSATRFLTCFKAAQMFFPFGFMGFPFSV